MREKGAGLKGAIGSKRKEGGSGRLAGDLGVMVGPSWCGGGLGGGGVRCRDGLLRGLLAEGNVFWGTRISAYCFCLRGLWGGVSNHCNRGRKSWWGCVGCVMGGDGVEETAVAISEGCQAALLEA